MTEKVVAFLDLLGFGNYVMENAEDANLLLNNYLTVLRTKINEEKIRPSSPDNIQRIQELDDNEYINSFEYFLPFSDSIFIVSGSPNKFLKQLSSFLLDCFLFTSYAYTCPANPEIPTEVTSVEFKRVEGGKMKKIEVKENWYPAIFRGGISYGGVFDEETNCIVNFVLKKTHNLSGEAVGTAVKLESTGRGPRLFCDSNFVQILRNESKRFIAQVEENRNYFEILWPAFYYDNSNDCTKEIDKFNDIFEPAANLWKAFSHKEYAQQYYQFLKLIVKSSLSYFSDRNFGYEAEQFIIEKIVGEGLELKVNDLVQHPLLYGQN